MTMKIRNLRKVEMEDIDPAKAILERMNFDTSFEMDVLSQITMPGGKNLRVLRYCPALINPTWHTIQPNRALLKVE